MTNTLCETTNCNKKVCARGFCVACYYRQLRNGKFESGTRTKKWKHRLSEINIENKKAICANCGSVKIVKRGKKSNNWRCSVESNARSKDYKKAYRQVKKEQLLDHCEICKTKENLCWDHNHATGIFRGTLCKDCNVAIGLLKDSEILCISAAEYLKNKGSYYEQKSQSSSLQEGII